MCLTYHQIQLNPGNQLFRGSLVRQVCTAPGFMASGPQMGTLFGLQDSDVVTSRTLRTIGISLFHIVRL